jgi:hypothetical protein
MDSSLDSSGVVQDGTIAGPQAMCAARWLPNRGLKAHADAHDCITSRERSQVQESRGMRSGREDIGRAL